MMRERLLAFLDRVWERRLGLVVAPAGSGKTVLMTQFAARASAAVGWYRAERGDGDTPVFLSHLEQAAHHALGSLDGAWTDEAAAAASLERAAPQRFLLLIDDGHFLAGTPGEAALRRLIGYLPDTARVVVAGRSEPAFDLSRLRLGGLVAELGADDLRFRLWEVERVFTHFYGVRLSPEEVAELARRTDGWAAGLQLFHLATTGRSPAERRTTMAALATRSRLAREYLSRHVLADLDEPTRRFLVRTSVLGRLSGALCDELLGRTGSASVLAMLEQRQLFTHQVDETSYRYHDVLRTHLEAMLVEEVGEPAAREERRRAGTLLERDPAGFSDALEAYCRAEDWDDASRLLGLHGERLADGASWWWKLLPQSLVAQDSWVTLAIARRHCAAGRWRDALAAYGHAEHIFAENAGADVCRREAAALAAWVDGRSAEAAPGWPGLLRTATITDPMRVAAAAQQPSNPLIAGWSALLAGHVSRALPALDLAAGDADATPVMRLCARAGLCIASALRGASVDDAFAGLADDAERCGILWLARVISRGVSHEDAIDVPGSPSSEATAIAEPWGAPLSALVRGWSAALLGAGQPTVAADAAAGFARAGAPVLACWAESVRAVAEWQQGSSRTAIRTAERAAATAHEANVPGARAYALHVIAIGTGDESLRAAARDCASQLGLLLPPLRQRRPPRGAPGTPSDDAPPWAPVAASPHATSAGVASLEITCLGRFTITVDGTAVDLSPVKPKARSLLRLLALHCGRPVHREVIMEALWPESDPEAGNHRLHVAVSSLRHVLGPRLWRCSSSIVHRESDAYRLVLPPGATIDLIEFHELVARAARCATDADAIAHLRRALAVYRDELLPEEGPAEWVTPERERCRGAAVAAATRLAALALAAGDASSAAGACHRGLAIDRYQDGLWRTLITIHERDQAPAAAERARRRYASVLADLDVSRR